MTFEPEKSIQSNISAPSLTWSAEFNMRVFIILLTLVSFESFGQSASLELFNNYIFKFNKRDWHNDENKTIDKSYQKQYTLEINKQYSKTTLNVYTLDYHSKNKNYPEGRSGEITSTGELNKYHDALVEKYKEDTTVVLELFKQKHFEDYKLMVIKVGSSLDSTDFHFSALASNVIRRFFVVGIVIENLNCETAEDAKKLLIGHLKKLKDES